MVFAANAFAFVLVLFAILTWKRKSDEIDTPLESFFDSLAAAVRYMRYAPGVQIVLLRNFTFGVLIGATPALIPVIGLKALHLHPLELGFVFTCMGLGSLAGALFILEPARKRLTPNQMTLLSSLVLAASYLLMAIGRNPQAFFIVAALAGVAWTVSASELWVAGQRVIPDWIRGRMNATHMMAGRSGFEFLIGESEILNERHRSIPQKKSRKLARDLQPRRDCGSWASGALQLPDGFS